MIVTLIEVKLVIYQQDFYNYKKYSLMEFLLKKIRSVKT